MVIRKPAQAGWMVCVWLGMLLLALSLAACTATPQAPAGGANPAEAGAPAASAGEAAPDPANTVAAGASGAENTNEADAPSQTDAPAPQVEDTPESADAIQAKWQASTHATTYVLDSDRLVLIRQTSLASTGAVRAIYIENPPSGSQSALPVHIQGNMPIAPFENNLVYRVYDLSFNELDAGPFSVTSADYGGPATFDNAIHSPAFIPGATVWFELRDASAADGTPLAIERIKLVIQ